MSAAAESPSGHHVDHGRWQASTESPGLTPPGLRAVCAVIGATGVAAVVLLWFVTWLEPDAHRTLSPGATAAICLGLFFAFLLADTFAVHVPLGRHRVTLTLSDVPLVVALAFLGPVLVVVVRVGGALFPLLRRAGVRPRKLVFNGFWLCTEACVAVLIWHAVMGTDPSVRPAMWLAAAASTVVIDFLGTVLISLVIAAETGTRPAIREMLTESNPLVAFANAAAGLAIVYIAVLDWRALWIAAVVIGVLAFAQHASHRQHQRTESLEFLMRFTGALGDQTDVESAVRTGITWVARNLQADVIQLLLTDGFAGEVAGWQMAPDGTVQQVPAAEVADCRPLIDAVLAGGPVLLRRPETASVAGRFLLRTGAYDGMATTLHGDGQRVGSLFVGKASADVRSFRTADLDTLVTLGNHLSVTLRNALRGDLIRKHAAEQLRRSLHDDLTGLPNRQHVEQVIRERLSVPAATMQALALDVDRFTDVNDALGHTIGDELLVQVARRLSAITPTGALVGRLHTDVFAVLLPDAGEPELDALAAVIREAFAVPVHIGDTPLDVTPRIGLAASRAGYPPADLLRHAVIALTAAAAKRVDLQWFTSTMAADPQRLTLLSELRAAIRADQLEVHYQPQISVRDGRVTGAEALARWQHPKHGPVFPDVFIPLAENGNLVTELTALVMRRSLQACSQWRRSGLDIGVAINISPRSLMEPIFVGMVTDLLAASDVPATAVTLEITESSLLEDPERAITALKQLRDLGVRLSVDDLGTGYSSLSYLHRLPVTEVKIDRSFLLPQASADESFKVVGGIVDLSHRIGFEVVAEGVEDEQTWKRLQLLDCDMAQGYWLGWPMDNERFQEWLADWRPELVALEAAGARVPASRLPT